MSKFEVIPFKAFHVRLMDLRPNERNMYTADSPFFYSAAQFAEGYGLGFTMISDDGIIGAAGAAKLFGTTYEAFTYTTPLFDKYWVQVHRGVRRFFDVFFECRSVERVQAFIDAQNPRAIKWAEKLKFEREGTLRNYGKKGQDFYVYARVKGVQYVSRSLR